MSRNTKESSAAYGPFEKGYNTVVRTLLLGSLSTTPHAALRIPSDTHLSHELEGNQSWQMPDRYFEPSVKWIFTKPVEKKRPTGHESLERIRLATAEINPSYNIREQANRNSTSFGQAGDMEVWLVLDQEEQPIAEGDWYRVTFQKPDQTERGNGYINSGAVDRRTIVPLPEAPRVEKIEYTGLEVDASSTNRSLGEDLRDTEFVTMGEEIEALPSVDDTPEIPMSKTNSTEISTSNEAKTEVLSIGITQQEVETESHAQTVRSELALGEVYYEPLIGQNAKVLQVYPQVILVAPETLGTAESDLPIDHIEFTLTPETMEGMFDYFWAVVYQALIAEQRTNREGQSYSQLLRLGNSPSIDEIRTALASQRGQWPEVPYGRGAVFLNPNVPVTWLVVDRQTAFNAYRAQAAHPEMSGYTFQGDQFVGAALHTTTAGGGVVLGGYLNSAMFSPAGLNESMGVLGKMMWLKSMIVDGRSPRDYSIQDWLDPLTVIANVNAWTGEKYRTNEPYLLEITTH